MSLRLIISSDDYDRIRSSGRGTFKTPLSIKSKADQDILGAELYESVVVS